MTMHHSISSTPPQRSKSAEKYVIVCLAIAAAVTTLIIAFIILLVYIKRKCKTVKKVKTKDIEMAFKSGQKPRVTPKPYLSSSDFAGGGHCKFEFENMDPSDEKRVGQVGFKRTETCMVVLTL
ncbi:hypothetical protein EJ02DRAFT_514337 [Clathrospora elynae]|uniref:Uncharacterized protein n=1 Tax=Clathrospora elynae TaxID=706981 RepID=A0A6A5SJF8_9PLEO|nr:hypothetical protein EJ02DRAFT_514337 [Clathrospora elynae]